jgi:DNA-binding winged helix-turn-helix (wHTH) protein
LNPNPIDMASRKISAGLFVLAGITLTIMMSHDFRPEEDILEKRLEVVVRKIGHDLLLDAGDSTSRIPPVIKTDQSYQLDFQNEFRFRSDSLVAITNRNFIAAGFKANHILSVIDRKTGQMVYGYEARGIHNPIDACLGRQQPTGDYAIQLTLTQPIIEEKNNNVTYFLVTAITIVAAVAFAWPKRSITPVKKFEFDNVTGTLKIDNQIVSLTNKESKVLKVLLANVNQVVDRETLQNEVWTSEGVITGRSLDVFISKLRKKFGADSDIRIENIHGVGYKLTMGTKRTR